MVTTISGSGSASAGPGYTVVASFPVFGAPYGVAVDPANHHIYITNWLPEAGTAPYVAVVDESSDAHTGTVTARIAVGNHPYGVAVDPSNHNVYVVNSWDDTLSVIHESGDANNGKVTATIPVGPRASNVAVDPSNHNVYVPSGRPDGQAGIVLSVINESGGPRSGQVVASIPLPGQPTGVAVDPSTHNVYVADDNFPNLGVLSVIDESGDATTGTVTAAIPVGAEPEGVAVDPSNHKVYVANFGFFGSAGSVSVINTSSDEGGPVTATIPVTEPYDVAVDPSSHNVYVTGADGGILSVIDERGDAGTGHVTASIAMGGDVADLAVDPFTHSIWVAADNSLLEIASRPRADLTTSISGPIGAGDGSQLVENVTIANRGPGPAAGTVTNLLVPDGLSVSLAPGAVLRSGTLVWNDGSLADGATVSHTVTFTVAANMHTTTTIGAATISTAAYDPNPINNAAVTTVRLG